MTELTKEQVKHLAKLSRLELTPKEITQYQKQLVSILEYVEKLNSVDTTEIEPTGQVTGLKNITRNDLIKDDKKQTEILSQAPQKEGQSYRVKAVFDK